MNSITLHGLFSDGAAKGNFRFKIDHTSINPHALDALKPKMHLRGLKHLIDKGLLVDNGSKNIAAELCKHLQEQLASTMEANKLKKARKMKKPTITHKNCETALLSLFNAMAKLHLMRGAEKNSLKSSRNIRRPLHSKR